MNVKELILFVSIIKQDQTDQYIFSDERTHCLVTIDISTANKYQKWCPVGALKEQKSEQIFIFRDCYKNLVNFSL
jgi:uncharacterized protein YdeI (BOF family)